MIACRTMEWATPSWTRRGIWLGWFGFNGGAVLSADPGLVSLVCVTTSLAAATGIIGAMFTSWAYQRKPDLSMVLNGALAGLVGITAGADVVSVSAAMLIGLVAGVIVVGSVLLIDRVKLDDPVGAVSVRLVCAIWGTLAVGLFSAEHSLLTQLVGVLAYAAASFPSAFLLCFALKQTLGLRVTAEEERIGLDVAEHGMEAYAGFQLTEPFAGTSVPTPTEGGTPADAAVAAEPATPGSILQLR